jgi:hypothetical protein
VAPLRGAFNPSGKTALSTNQTNLSKNRKRQQSLTVISLKVWLFDSHCFRNRENLTSLRVNPDERHTFEAWCVIIETHQ